MQAQVEAMIEANPVLVMATSTCPFCIEVRERERDKRERPQEREMERPQK